MNERAFWIKFQMPEWPKSNVKEDLGRASTCRKNGNVLWKSTAFLRFVLGAPGVVGPNTLTYVCKFLQVLFRKKVFLWWVPPMVKKKEHKEQAVTLLVGFLWRARPLAEAKTALDCASRANLRRPKSLDSMCSTSRTL